MLPSTRRNIKCDGASANVCGEMAHEIFNQFPKDYPYTTQVSFVPYCRNHGKCISDTIFHFIDSWIALAKLAQDILTVYEVQQDVVDSLTLINDMKSQDSKKMDMVVLKHALRKKPSSKKEILHIDGI